MYLRSFAHIFALLALLGLVVACQDDVPPVADFIFSGGDYAPPCTVTFSNQSSGKNLSFTWDFGDGSFSSDENPTHTYTTSGSYTVRLTAKNAAGSHEMSRVVTVKNLKQVPVASFAYSYANNDSTAPATIYFESTSLGDSLEYLWDFGDGGSSTDSEPEHQYTTTGTYTVKLLVRNRYSQNETSKTVVIKPGPPTPTKVKIDYITLQNINDWNLSVGTSKVTMSISDMFGNVLVQSTPRNVTTQELPLGISLGWDTEPLLTDLAASYRIIIKMEYNGYINQEVTAWTPNTTLKENQLFMSNSLANATAHIVWSN